MKENIVLASPRLPPSFFLYAPFPLRIVHWERCLIKFSPAGVRVSIVRRHIVQFVLQRLFYALASIDTFSQTLLNSGESVRREIKND